MSFLNEEKLNFSAKSWLGILGTGDKDSSVDALAWYEEPFSRGEIVVPNQVWIDYSSLPPAEDLATAQTNATLLPTIIEDISLISDAIHLTPSPNNKVFFATSTFGDMGTRLKNWIMPQIVPRTDTGFVGFPSIGYMIKLWNGDPNSGGTEIPTTAEKNGGNVGWFMNFYDGAIKVASSFTSVIDPNDVWLTGFRYIGRTIDDLSSPFVTVNDTINPSTTKVIDSILNTNVKVAEWTIYLKTGIKYRASKVMALNKNNIDSFYNEYSGMGDKIANVKPLIEMNAGFLQLKIQNNSADIVNITSMRIITS